MIFKRLLDLKALLKNKSFFLLGPRATGKSFLIREQLADKCLLINLLESKSYLRLSAEPHLLPQMIHAAPPHQIVVIDEVQRIPMLLNEVHRLIEEEGVTFLLTGSSARKLRQKDVNLLAGRAWQANLFPLTYSEIPNFDLERYLLYGGLPAVYASNHPKEELYAYVDTYLQEEIRAEAVVRKIPAFARFLQTSALTSGQILNFSNVANDTGVPISTVRDYYSILEDTLLGFIVPTWTKTVKRKATATAKFFYFDAGVKNILSKTEMLDPHSDLYGLAFEHFIALEIRAYLSYRRHRKTLSYWRTEQGHEVDFIIGDEIAIEVKAASKISNKHLKGLRLLEEENICQHYFLVSKDPIPQRIDNIDILPWQTFLEQLWQDKIILP